MNIRAEDIAVDAGDGHRWQLLARVPATPRRSLLWLPALGIAARHYASLADALAARGIATFVHEWRGNGSSSLRASRQQDWGYRELLSLDVPASAARVAALLPGAARVMGGHSLGGQLACCRLALDATAARELWLAGSGSPYWRAFPLPHRLGLPLAYRFLPWLAGRVGYLPGRRVGFGGNEARGLIRDWSASAISGRYGARGLEVDLESAMARVSVPLRAVAFEEDWLAPASSLRFLAAKMPAAPLQLTVFDSHRLGTRADHYAWMKQPAAVAAWLDGRA